MSEQDATENIDLAVIGGGPAGLAAAEAAAESLGAGARIAVFEAKPSLGRKLLMAGKSGLNITHAEPLDLLLSRYRGCDGPVRAAIEGFAPEAICAWMAGLGQESFTGSSGRVFPVAMKASPLLRAWLARLAALGVETRPRWRWRGMKGRAHVFDTPDGPRRVAARASVLAMGGASWPRLGSDGAWAPVLAALGVEVEPFRPSNIGWRVDWSDYFRQRFAGAPLKPVRLFAGARSAQGELIVTGYGLEGGPLYALAPELLAGGRARLDLAPDRSLEALAAALTKPRGGNSFANWLRKAARLDAAKIALLREPGGQPPPEDPAALAARVKSLPLALAGPRPIEEGISTAGGLACEALTPELELSAAPGLFAAGEMLAWDAPTGGYLLSGCLATGRLAGAAAARRIRAAGGS